MQKISVHIEFVLSGSPPCFFKRTPELVTTWNTMIDIYMKENRGKLMNEPTKSGAKVAFLVLRREPVDRILFHLSPKKLDFEYVTPNIYPPSNEESLSLVKNAQIIVTDIMITREILDKANDLRFIQQLGAGIEKIDFTTLRGKDIYVANTSGGNATAVAEHTMALILALAKKITILNNDMSKGEFPNLWDQSKPGIIELKGKTLGIVGLGSIGTAIAELAKAFGMRLLAVKRHKNQKGDIELDFIGGPEDLGFLLEKSDFVVISLPLTSETRGLIGESQFNMMKQTAFIVNISRGPIIDEKALYGALKTKRIAGAGIDTWYLYSIGRGPPSNLPIYTLKNVIKTPHIAGLTEESKEGAYVIAARNIVKFLKGQIPDNLCNIELGY